ncbi:LysR family transcriptional regulator [Granulosicoccus antarcticus]|uniref:HTH-type transcriptional regulator GltR n=1 Tax=Granulosicoccus antarcticus IMCC3135 TaxID=1192854 RepID=A0A2Z2P1E4_9GAMM|nr:LysR family transcriptional regulator [Granulosicoccus antarcticus]ASJ74257.1 HTH-type transcriptional regulator GltR [Granulosicoccus antarcticus IMCC3135]
MNEPSLDDLRLFLVVASEGSLSAAAKRLSASTATLSRRINQLEQQTGRSLFHRQPSGYELTADGASLRERVLQLDAVRAELADWLAEPTRRPMVRLSAGTWTCNLLVEHISQLHQKDDAFGLVFVSTEERLSIAHREVDIGLRNTRPDDPHLVTRRIGEVCYASYAATDRELADGEEQRWPWLLVAPDCAHTRSAHWMVEHRLSQAVLQVTASRTLLDLTVAGAGVTVLPCFVGDRLPSLRRVGPLIDELTESQWLVMHSETRHRPAVRTVIERIGIMISNYADLYSGKCQREPI